MKIRLKRKKNKSKKQKNVKDVIQPEEETPLLLISPSLDTGYLSTTEESMSRARHSLYKSHLAAKFTEIGWEFCLVLFLSALTGYQSLALVSTYGLFSGLVVCLAGASVGTLVDAKKYTRLEIIQFFILVQNVSVIIATACCYFLLRMVKDTSVTNVSWEPPDRYLASGSPTITRHTFSNFIPPFNAESLALLVAVHVFGAIAKLTDQAITIALERDWIVVMSKVAAMDLDEDELEFRTEESGYEEGASFDSNDTLAVYSVGSLSISQIDGMDTRVIRKLKQKSWLSETNTNMKQIDLMCKVVAPAAGGFLFSAFDNNDPSTNNVDMDIRHWYNLSYASVLIGFLNLLSLYIEYTSTKEIYDLVPLLSSRDSMKDEKDCDVTEKPSKSPVAKSIGGCGIFGLPQSLSVYLQQPVAAGGLALSLLYLNVLTFGGLMTAYLVWLGVNYSTIGILRGISSVIGLLGTVVFHFSERSRGLAKTGMWSIGVQFGFLALCYVSLYVPNLQASLWLLVIGVCCSRIGLWSFDLTITQYMQQTIPENIRGQIGGVQSGLNSLFDLTTFALGLIFSDPQEFHILVAAGFSSVALSMLLYFMGIYRRREKLDL